MAMSRGAAPGRRPSSVDPDWLTLGQAAKYLGVAQSTIRKWSDQGLVPAFYTPGGHRRFRRRDLDGFLARSGRAQQPGPLVLIVDGDPLLRRAVRASLGSQGGSVREAGNADEGMAALEDEAPDLILLDVMMPEVDGWELLRRVQEKHGVGTIPVIMFSGGVEEGADEPASRGAQGFVGKPFDPESLIESTKALLPV